MIVMILRKKLPKSSHSPTQGPRQPLEVQADFRATNRIAHPTHSLSQLKEAKFGTDDMQTAVRRQVESPQVYFLPAL